jgi:hypothetical protein
MNGQLRDSATSNPSKPAAENSARRTWEYSQRSRRRNHVLCQLIALTVPKRIDVEEAVAQAF